MHLNISLMGAWWLTLLRFRKFSFCVLVSNVEDRQLAAKLRISSEMPTSSSVSPPYLGKGGGERGMRRRRGGGRERERERERERGGGGKKREEEGEKKNELSVYMFSLVYPFFIYSQGVLRWF